MTKAPATTKPCPRCGGTMLAMVINKSEAVFVCATSDQCFFPLDAPDGDPAAGALTVPATAVVGATVADYKALRKDTGGA